MAKKITALPAEEIIIKFNDNELKATFNMLAVGYMQHELTKKRKKKLTMVDLGVLILYSGIRVNQPDFTLEEARALALTINPASLNEIIEACMESAGTENELITEAQKKNMMQMLTNIAELNVND